MTPIEPKFHEDMNSLAKTLDFIFNGSAKGHERKVGFVLLAFNFGDETKVNYISNAERSGIISTLKEMIARFEGQPNISGSS